MALSQALKQIELNHGKGSLMKLGDRQVEAVEVFSTGSLSLDQALGTGGIPRGRIAEIYGTESSGKTTIALQIIAEAQKAGATCVFIDAEHALDPAYAQGIGVDLDSLYISQPDNGEQALDIVEQLVRTNEVGVIVVDSVAALVPKAELEGEMGDHHIALQARLMSQALRKLTAVCSKSNCAIIFINQVRHKVGVIFGSNEVTSGGNALRFYSSVRLEVRRGQQLKKDGQVIGCGIRVKVAKNKLAPPFGQAEFNLIFGSGADRLGELLDLGVKSKIITVSGAWFHMMTEEGEKICIGQGKDKARQYLAENPDFAARIQSHIDSFVRAGGSNQINVKEEESVSSLKDITTIEDHFSIDDIETLNNDLGTTDANEMKTVTPPL
eukprot:CAMPEP_0117749166 /NCGR_PEP_ID=MMETSP0947-20121206/9574_1 /TAXON_ID=44440 /ORGANISM="Chattonella subsalsa, Strain CCMP2191" /LENGTH=381 /DNA_ID=CAMNT_0005567017 /DNA_START=193 /DNA_END=1338 /DNA_ORIENTATION=+